MTMNATPVLSHYQVTRISVPRSTSNGLYSALAATTSVGRPEGVAQFTILRVV